MVEQWRFVGGDNQLWSIEKLNNVKTTYKTISIKPTFAIFPNPTNTGEIKFTYVHEGKNENANVQIKNMEGRIVYQKTLVLQAGINSNIIDITKYSKAIYFVTLSMISSKKEYVQKVVVE